MDREVFKKAGPERERLKNPGQTEGEKKKWLEVEEGERVGGARKKLFLIQNLSK